MEQSLKNPTRKLSVLMLFWATTLILGCAGGGGPVIITDADHQVNVFTSVSDSEPLSRAVRRALRNNGQTAVSQISVSQDSDDTVKLTGTVDNDAVIHEAERVAYQVEGVRFVVNNLIPSR